MDAPKDGSWPYQVEGRSGTPARKLLRQAGFESLEDLGRRILESLNHFDRAMSRPIEPLLSPRPIEEEFPSG